MSTTPEDLTERLRAAVAVTAPSDGTIANWWRIAETRSADTLPPGRAPRRRPGIVLLVAAIALLGVLVAAVVVRERSATQVNVGGDSGSSPTQVTDPTEPSLGVVDNGVTRGFVVDLQASPSDLLAGYRQTPVVAFQRLGPHGWYTTHVVYTVPPNQTQDPERICGFDVGVRWQQSGSFGAGFPSDPATPASCDATDFTQPLAASQKIQLPHDLYAGQNRLCRWTAQIGGDGSTVSAPKLLCADLHVSGPPAPTKHLVPSDCPPSDATDVLLISPGTGPTEPWRITRTAFNQLGAAGPAGAIALYDRDCNIRAYDMIGSDFLTPEQFNAPDFDPLEAMSHYGTAIDRRTTTEVETWKIGPQPGQTADDGTTIANLTIDRLGFRGDVVQGVADHNIWHIATSPKPGQAGNSVLQLAGNALATSAGSGLLRLVPGDTLVVEADGTTSTYVVIPAATAGPGGQALPTATGAEQGGASCPDPADNVWLGDLGDSRLTVVDQSFRCLNGGATVIAAVRQ
jgi:hypothetical protein